MDRVGRPVGVDQRRWCRCGRDRMAEARRTSVTVVAEVVGQVHDHLLRFAQRKSGRHLTVYRDFTVYPDFAAGDAQRAHEVALAEGLGDPAVRSRNGVDGRCGTGGLHGG